LSVSLFNKKKPTNTFSNQYLFIIGFHVIYNGLDTEYLLEQLIPGHLYSLRLSCSSIGGHSIPSDITQIKTPAVAPASCHPPKISGKAKANSLHLRWGKGFYLVIFYNYSLFSIS
jgi:hypothetical protein